MIEILVVLGLILILATLAIPAVSALRGTRSAEAGANVAAAMLSRARAEAVNRAAPVGVLFYLDPEEGRSTMVLVGTPSASLVDPDPFDQYHGWRPDVDYVTQNTGTDPVTTADTVIVLQQDNTTGRPLVRKFVCIADHTSAAGNAPPQPPATANATWGVVDSVPSGGLELLFDEEDGDATGNVTLGSEVLPNGVGLQVIVEPATNTAGEPTSDRYTRTGVIMFDADGKLLSTTVDLTANSSLGVLLGFDNGTPGDISDDRPSLRLNTAFGIIAYNDGDFGASDQRTDADWGFNFGGSIGYVPYYDPIGAAYSLKSAVPDEPSAGFLSGNYRDTPELAEEQWLDRNATPLMINRFSGLPFNTDGTASVN